MEARMAAGDMRIVRYPVLMLHGEDERTLTDVAGVA
jgi:hypothetical protein